MVVQTHEVSLAEWGWQVSMQEKFQEYPLSEEGGPRDAVGVSLHVSVLSYVTACGCGCWVFMRRQINVVSFHGHYSVSGIFLKMVLESSVVLTGTYYSNCWS